MAQDIPLPFTDDEVEASGDGAVKFMLMAVGTAILVIMVRIGMVLAGVIQGTFEETTGITLGEEEEQNTETTQEEQEDTVIV